MVDSYNNQIPNDPQGFFKKINEIKDSLKSFSITDIYLLWMGEIIENQYKILLS